MVASFTEDDEYRIVETNTCPLYDNPGWNYPNTACSVIKISLNPKFATIPIPVGEAHSEYAGTTYVKPDPSPIFGALGVLLKCLE